MIRITQDNGNKIFLDLLISVECNSLANKNGADSEVINIKGMDKDGNYSKAFRQDLPEAIRTIEFLP